MREIRNERYFYYNLCMAVSWWSIVALFLITSKNYKLFNRFVGLYGKHPLEQPAKLNKKSTIY